MNNKVGKIMTNQDEMRTQQWVLNRDLQVTKHIHEIITNKDHNDSIRLLLDKIAKLDEKINNLREELNGKVTLGNNGTILQPNGEIK